MIYSKRMIMIAAISAVISLSAALMPDQTNASPSLAKVKETGQQTQLPGTAEENLFVGMLGADSAEEIKESLYNGSSLADIAGTNGTDVQHIIALQITELAIQLQERLAAGSITEAQYEAQLAELPEIVTSSVYSRYN